MNILFTPHAWEDYEYWINEDSTISKKIIELIIAIRKDPFKGIGKPEPLKHALKGFWSRRITREHRLVYTISGTKGKDQVCKIVQCRFHYDE